MRRCVALRRRSGCHPICGARATSGMPDVTVAEQRERLGAWAQRRPRGATVEWRETHVSLLAFTDDRVWKCKKAVCFPFIDLSTAALRRENCEREVALNRRLAP